MGNYETNPVITESYDSLNSLIKTIGKRTVNKTFAGEELSSEREGGEFNGTKNYKESVLIATNGFQEGLKDLTKGNKSFHRMAEAERNIPKADVVGHVPHVANYVSGMPLTMIKSSTTPMKGKVITIGYGGGIAGHEDKEELVLSGKNMLSAITMLELRGYRVGLVMVDVFCGSKQVVMTTTMLKNWQQQTNFLKIAYPVVHPSYFRRTMFKWLETIPGLDDRSFIGGYGRCFFAAIGKNAQERAAYLKKHKVLKPDWMYVEIEDARKGSPEDLIERLKLPQ